MDSGIFGFREWGIIGRVRSKQITGHLDQLLQFHLFIYFFVQPWPWHSLTSRTIIPYRRKLRNRSNEKAHQFFILMSLSSCFPHATYHLHSTSHPHFTNFVFSTHKNSKNIKTGWKDNKVKLPASAAFFVLLWAKIGSVE